MGLLERYEQLAGIPTGLAEERFGPVTSYEGASVSSGYGPRNAGIFGSSRNHKAWDISGERGSYQISGQPATAAAGGTVVSAGPTGGYGNRVTIQHDNGYRTTYSHLDAIDPSITPGASVAAGQSLGPIGNTGLRGMADHLHFEVMDETGRKVSPQTVGYEAVGGAFGRPAVVSPAQLSNISTATGGLLPGIGAAYATQQGQAPLDMTGIDPNMPGFGIAGPPPEAVVAQTQPVGISAAQAAPAPNAAAAAADMMAAPAAPTAAAGIAGPAPAAPSPEALYASPVGPGLVMGAQPSPPGPMAQAAPPGPAAQAAPPGPPAMGFDATQAALDQQTAQLAAGPAAMAPTPAPTANAQVDAAFGQFAPEAPAAPAAPDPGRFDAAFGQFEMADAPSGPTAIANATAAGPLRDAFNTDQQAALQASQSTVQAPAAPAAPTPSAPTGIASAPPAAASVGIGSMAAPQAPAAGIASAYQGGFSGRTVPGLDSTTANLAGAMGIGAAPSGMSLGYSPVGSGFSYVSDSAPSHVQAAASGPGLFGAMNRDFGGQFGSGLENGLSGFGSSFTGRTGGAVAGGLAGAAFGGPIGGLAGAALGGIAGGAGQRAGMAAAGGSARSGGIFGGMFDRLGSMFAGASSGTGGGVSAGGTAGTSGSSVGGGWGGGGIGFGDTERNGGRV
jgi:hypothetical protein